MSSILGTILSGSLRDGFTMRIAPNIQEDQLKTGKFVSIKSNAGSFFSLITDLKLEVTNPDILLFPPSQKETLLTSLLKQRDMYATACIKPMIMLTKNNTISPVKTIPSHFAPVHTATPQEIALIFGDEKDPSKRYFTIGSPLDMDAPVCLDLERLTERSNGIFGKTGTGKTFLTRLVLAGLIKNNKAVNLIFDMHSEYGSQARQEGKNATFVKGLKTLWPDKVVIASLDPTATRSRGTSPDISVTLDYQAIRVEDLLSLQDELALHATACEAAYLLASKFKKDWLKELLARGSHLKELAQETGAHPESISALYRKLKQIERLPFFIPDYKSNSIEQIIEYLDRGVSVIIEFGNYTSTFCYLLIANIITRAIHKKYTEKTEKYLCSGLASDEPKRLMITIEEAHKFLNPTAAKQTIFGIIAREMRKYYVSLLVVDQRPSGIDAEVLSQIGTKIIAQLSDEKDIAAVLTGAAHAQDLRTILSTLDSKKQVLLVGHALTLPIVVQTREYNEQFYRDMAPIIETKNIEQLMNELF